ncbi:hypothetical protein K0M31_016462, partial [Melipona bicolor]
CKVARKASFSSPFQRSNTIIGLQMAMVILDSEYFTLFAPTRSSKSSSSGGGDGGGGGGYRLTFTAKRKRGARFTGPSPGDNSGVYHD